MSIIETTAAGKHTELPTVDWQDLQEASCLLATEIPVRGFAVRDLILLQVGALVNSKAKARGRVKLCANGSLIAWADFTAVNDRRGVRLTELE